MGFFFFPAPVVQDSTSNLTLRQLNDKQTGQDEL